MRETIGSNPSVTPCPRGERPKEPKVTARAHRGIWVEDALILLGIALLWPSVLRWSSAVWRWVLWADLLMMAGVFVLRLRRLFSLRSARPTANGSGGPAPFPPFPGPRDRPGGRK